LRELVIQIDSINPIEIFGPNNQNVGLLRKNYPQLKIIARGDRIKVVGQEDDLEEFEMKFKQMIDYFNKYNILAENDVQQLLDSNNNAPPVAKDGGQGGEVLVYGNNGMVIKAKTANQRAMVKSSEKNDLVIAIGPAGSGKTYTAVALAVRALRNKEVRKIILTRPAVEAGENLGFLPGDLKEKLDPYLQPLYDALGDMIPSEKLETYLETGVIQIAPIAFMRGRTLDKAFVILDEAQNATESQIKMFLTRMGKSAKFVITGDVTQIDLPKNQPSGLVQIQKVLKGVKGIEFIKLDANDVIRHKLVKQIIGAYEKMENENKNKDE